MGDARKDFPRPEIRMFGEWLPLIMIACVVVVFALLGGGPGGG